MLPSLFDKALLPSLVDEFFGRELFPGFFKNRTGIDTPAVNIIESDTEFRLEVAAAGLEKEDFKVDVQHQTITVSCQKEDKRENTGDKYMRREFSYSSFTRSFSLPDSADSDKISATHKHGVLTIIIPKKETAIAKPTREIKIS